MALTAIAIAGLGVLFGKLQQGIVENQQILLLAQMRADAEELYGSKLAAIPAATDRPGGFSRDDGATAKQVRLEPPFVSFCILLIFWGFYFYFYFYYFNFNFNFYFIFFAFILLFWCFCFFVFLLFLFLFLLNFLG